MTVSIIIAVKTWQKNLEECVAKCRELDYPDFEIIVLPDAEAGTVPAIAIADSSKGTVPAIGIADDKGETGTVPANSYGTPSVAIADDKGETGTVPANSCGTPSVKAIGSAQQESVPFADVPIQIIPTGPVNPAQKRDLAISAAKGEILAFIDDDAYPRPDWLKNALVHFEDPDIAAVGGPAVTPPSDDLRQKASGLVYSSILVSGQYVYRYLPGKKTYVDDFPSCNFLVRKSVMQELGGFKTGLWPGEDTKLCLDITKVLGKKIIYDPQVFVYHHRRRLYSPHLQQIENYALHRGYFVKKYPQTSLKIAYFIPSIFFLGVVASGVVSLFFPVLRQFYFLGISLYLAIVFIFSLNKNILLILFVFSGIILTHLAYGVYFLKGLLSVRMKEESKAKL